MFGRWHQGVKSLVLFLFYFYNSFAVASIRKFYSRNHDLDFRGKFIVIMGKV